MDDDRHPTGQICYDKLLALDSLTTLPVFINDMLAAISRLTAIF